MVHREHRALFGNAILEAHIGTQACQKSFIILIGATSKQASPSNGSGCAGARATSTTAGWTLRAADAQINTRNLGARPGLDSTSYVDEWARYFNQTDFNNNVERPAEHRHVHDHGRLGPRYPLPERRLHSGACTARRTRAVARHSRHRLQLDEAGAAADLQRGRAVNSVFASSSLPISSNTQGTYQNQVFIGMFRPDARRQPALARQPEAVPVRRRRHQRESDAVPRRRHRYGGDQGVYGLHHPERPRASGPPRTRSKLPDSISRPAGSG